MCYFGGRNLREVNRLQHDRINPSNYLSHPRESRLLRAIRWRAVLIDLLSVQSPCNAVKFNVGPLDFAKLIDRQEIEALHSVLARSDLWEQPMPHNLVARVNDVERLDVWVWMLENLTCPLSSRGGRWSVGELVFLLENTVRQYVEKLLTGASSSDRMESEYST